MCMDLHTGDGILFPSWLQKNKARLQMREVRLGPNAQGGQMVEPLVPWSGHPCQANGACGKSRRRLRRYRPARNNVEAICRLHMPQFMPALVPTRLGMLILRDDQRLVLYGLAELRDPYCTMALIGMGRTLPCCQCQLTWFDEIKQQKQVSIPSMAAGKRSMLFGVLGAGLHPTCSSLASSSGIGSTTPSWCSSTT